MLTPSQLDQIRQGEASVCDFCLVSHNQCGGCNSEALTAHVLNEGDLNESNPGDGAGGDTG